MPLRQRAVRVQPHQPGGYALRLTLRPRFTVFAPAEIDAVDCGCSICTKKGRYPHLVRVRGCVRACVRPRLTPRRRVRLCLQATSALTVATRLWPSLTPLAPTLRGTCSAATAVRACARVGGCAASARRCSHPRARRHPRVQRPARRCGFQRHASAGAGGCERAVLGSGQCVVRHGDCSHAHTRLPPALTRALRTHAGGVL